MAPPSPNTTRGSSLGNSPRPHITTTNVNRQQATCCAQQVAYYPQQVACCPQHVERNTQLVARNKQHVARNLLRWCKRRIRLIAETVARSVDDSHPSCRDIV